MAAAPGDIWLPSPASELRRWLLLTLASLFLVAELLPVLRAFPNGLIEDDGYFYAQVGYNLGQHSFSSFDGLHQTSGYHLLWGMFLGGVSKVVGLFTTAKESHLAAFYFCGVWLSGFVALRFFRDPISRATAFCLLLFGFTLAETVLLAAVAVAIVRRLLEPSSPFGARAGDGWLVALVPLIRIDALPLALVFVSSLAWRDWRAFRRLATAAAAGAALHFAWMYSVFGEFFSVSSMVKASALQPSLHDLATGIVDNMRINIVWTKSHVVRFGAVWLFTALALWRLRSTADRETRRGTLFGIAGVMAFYLPHFFLNHMRSWYFVPVHLPLLYIVARDTPGTRATFRWRAVVESACVVLIVAYVAGIAYVNTTFGRDQIVVAAFVSRLRDVVPEGARIFARDGSGYIGFFTERAVINGDGLMNDYAYAARLRAGRLSGYLEENQVCFVITNRPIVSDTIADVGGLVVKGADVERVYAVDAGGVSDFGFMQLFRLRRAGCEATKR